ESSLQRSHVDLLELLLVGEVLPHGVGPGRMLVQDREVQLIGPPVLVRPRPMRRRRRRRDGRALALAAALGHGNLPPCCARLSLDMDAVSFSEPRRVNSTGQQTALVSR